MPWILTNDDGIDAPGIAALQEAIRQIAPTQPTVIVAPSQEQSGCGHQVTTGRPIVVEVRSTASSYGIGGNDTLVGGNGNDTLTGGADADEFVFGGGGNAFTSIGLDTLTDFTVNVDKLTLSRSTFTALTIGASLSGADFATVSTDAAAATSSGLIVYNSSNGSLFYNPNGNAADFGTGGQFASLTGNPGLTGTDFKIVA